MLKIELLVGISSTEQCGMEVTILRTIDSFDKKMREGSGYVQMQIADCALKKSPVIFNLTIDNML